jgi:hypothetical protein
MERIIPTGSWRLWLPGWVRLRRHGTETIWRLVVDGLVIIGIIAPLIYIIIIVWATLKVTVVCVLRRRWVIIRVGCSCGKMMRTRGRQSHCMPGLLKRRAAMC